MAATALSAEEQDQILQTIDMFEVITQTQPDDYQSIEILKEAYLKLGRTDDAISASVRLAKAYSVTGQISLAFQECEGILSQQPTNPEIQALMGELENQMQAAVQSNSEASAALDAFNRAEEDDPDGSITVTEMTRRRGSDDLEDRLLNDDGNASLAKFLVKNDLFEEDTVMQALDQANTHNAKRNEQNPEQYFILTSLLETIGKVGRIPEEDLISRVIDKTRMAFAPIDLYQIDRHIVQLLPEAITLGRLILPFDQMSRTVMVATCNPLDEAGREAVQQSLEYSIHWYLATPRAIYKSLSNVYRLNARD